MLAVGELLYYSHATIALGPDSWPTTVYSTALYSTVCSYSNDGYLLDAILHIVLCKVLVPCVNTITVRFVPMRARSKCSMRLLLKEAM